MKLSTHDRLALKTWMDTEKLALTDVAKLLKVTHVSVMKWCKGGGIRPTQLARLRAFINPHISFDMANGPAQELAGLREKLQKHAETHQDLISFHLAALDQIEDFLSRQA